MPEKPWVTAFGKASQNLEGEDVLLSDKVSERRRKQIDRQEEIDEAEHKARKAKLEKDTVSSEAAVEKTGEKKEDTGGFKVHGEVNMGSIDMGEERRERKEAMEKERADSKAEAERLRKEVSDSTNRTTQENNQLRGDLHAAEMREMKASNDAAIASIRDKIDGRSPVEIIADIRTMAAELGLKAPDPGVSDPALQIQILELQHAETQRDREFQWDKIKHAEDMEERREERNDKQSIALAQLAQQQKRDEMFGNAPKMIGGAIAEGLLAKGEGGISEKPKSKKGYRVEITEGETATVECPDCSQPVGVGPTARKAVCANCGTEMSVKRIGPSGEPEEE